MCECFKAPSLPAGRAGGVSNQASLHSSCFCARLQGIFGTEAFSKIKKGARIVNVARGGVIDDVALAKALDDKVVAGAALDVFAVEPPPADHPLVGRPDVIVTPHLGASTVEAQEGVAVEIAEAVIDALKVCRATISFQGLFFCGAVRQWLPPATSRPEAIA